VPLELLVRDQHVWHVGPATATLSSQEAGVVFLLGLTAIVGFAFGFSLAGGEPAEFHALPEDSGRYGHSRVLITVAALAFLVLFAVSRHTPLTSHTYGGNVSAAASSPLYSYLVGLWCVTTGVLAARLLRAPGLRRVVGATLIVALVGWGLYSSNKDPLLIG